MNEFLMTYDGDDERIQCIAVCTSIFGEDFDYDRGGLDAVISDERCSSDDRKCAITFKVAFPVDSVGSNEDPQTNTWALHGELLDGYPATTALRGYVSAAHIGNAKLQQLSFELQQWLDENIGREIVFDAIEWMKEKAVQMETMKLVQGSKSSGGHSISDGSGCHDSHVTMEAATVHLEVAVLHIDHMRSKTKYKATLRAWADELCLHGTLACHPHTIIVVLFGIDSAISEFVKRLRTVKIDVDSHGKPCKERMLTILCRQPHEGCQIDSPSFTVNDVQSDNELGALIDNLGIGVTLESYMFPRRRGKPSDDDGVRGSHAGAGGAAYKVDVVDDREAKHTRGGKGGGKCGSKGGGNIAKSVKATTSGVGSACPVQACADASVLITVTAKPGARASEIVGTEDGGESVSIRVGAPARDGEANAELMSFLASELKIKKGHLQLVAGGRSHSKTFIANGTTLEDARRALGV